MRRRRQKNTLLPKMLGLAVVINAILLPILARMGAFKSIGGQRLTPVEIVKLPPPEKRPAPPKKTAKRATPKTHPAGRKTAARPAASHRAASGPPPVRVVAAGPAAGGSGGGGDAGIASSDAPPVPPPPPAPLPLPITSSPPAPPPPAAAPAPPPLPAPPAPPPAPHAPVLAAAVPLAKPQPTIPDDLRDADLSAAFEGLFTVHADGTASVKMVSSTGNPALDALALDAARRWTFRPATRDGEPVQSFLRLRVEFDVSS